MTPAAVSHQIVLTKINGATPVLTNGIIGGWAIVNNTEFATYSATTGVAALNQTTFPGYTSATLPATPGGATQNIRPTNASFAIPATAP